jgi:hypothetical protein
MHPDVVSCFYFLLLVNYIRILSYVELLIVSWFCEGWV